MDLIGYSLGNTLTMQELQHWDSFPAFVVLANGDTVHGMKLGDTISRQKLVERFLSITEGVVTPDVVVFDGAKTVVNRVKQAPPPASLDPFYGPVVLDAGGNWVQQPYTVEEMKPKLEQHSADIRYRYETDGVMIHPPTGSDYGANTLRDARGLLDSAFTALQSGSLPTAMAKLMRIKTLSPPVFGSVLFVRVDLTKITEIKKGVDKWSDLCFSKESDLFNQIEAGTVTTKDQIEAAYLAMRTAEWPIAP